MGLPGSQRLRRQCDFQQVRSYGLRVHSGAFVLQYAPSGSQSIGTPVLGIIASRRVGNAVKRNRGKRLFREIFRSQAGTLSGGCSLSAGRYVIILRASYDQYDYSSLENQFIQACVAVTRQARVFQSPA